MNHFPWAIFIILFSIQTSAGECVLKIAREACPGKNLEAYKPYKGKTETEEKKTLANQEACANEAQKAAQIVRKGTLTKKTVTASFDGQTIAQDFIGTADCK